MKETALKIKKGLAIIMIWVLMFNNIPMLNLLVNAQESVDIEITEEDNSQQNSGRSHVIDYPENHLFSVSCGDSDWENYAYVIQEMPVGSVSCGDQLNVSGCPLPVSFIINKLNGEALEESINVTINALKTRIEFNEQLKNLNGEFVYGTSKTLSCEASIVEGLSEGRAIAYAITEGADIAEISETGELTFKDGMLGTVKVKASVAATNRYAAAEAECAINVKCVEPVGLEYYKLNESNEKVETVSAKSAYNHSVGIFAPSNYQLLESNEISNPSVLESIIISEECVFEKTVYLRNTQTGAISSQKDLRIVIDETAPVLGCVEFSQWYGGESVKDDGSSLDDKEYIADDYPLTKDNGKNVKLYYNDNVEMTFTVTEKNLSSDKVIIKEYNTNNPYPSEYTYDWEAVGTEDDGVWSVTHTIEKDANSDKTCYVTFEVSDKADNKITYRSEYLYIQRSQTLVALDYDAWSYAEKIENEEYVGEHKAGQNSDVRLYYNDSMKMTLTDSQYNRNWANVYIFDFLEGDTVKRSPATWNWQGKYEYRIEEEGEHLITIFRENKNNNNDTASQVLEHIIIDKNAPIITAEHEGTCDLVLDDNNNEITLNSEYKYGEHPEFKLYYQDNTTLKFSIKEVSFDKNNVKFYDSYYVDDELRNVEWKQNGDVWTAEYPLTEKVAGVHQITIKCTDKLGKYSEYISEQIVIDNTLAQWAEPKVEYTQWLTDGTIFGDPDYSVSAGYQPGTDSNVKLYFNINTDITFYIKKAYFNPDYVKLVDHYKSDRGNESNIEVALEWVQVDNSDIWKATYQIPKAKVGEHVIELAYKRINADTNDICWTSEKINIIDTDLPEFQKVIYSGFSRVENQNGDVVELNSDNGNLINDNMKVYAHEELVLNFLFKDASVADINKLKIVDTYNGVRREKYPVAWTNTVTAQEEWRTAYKVLPTEPGEHIITVEYDNDTGEDIKLITSALITMDNKEAQLDKVTFDVSSGDSVVLEPKDNTIQGDGITRYYNQNVEIDFEIDEVFFVENDLVISDVDEENNARELQYSVEFVDGKYHVVCLIPDALEGMHKIALKYLDKCYDKEVEYNVQVVIDIALPMPDKTLPIDYGKWIAAEEVNTSDESQIYNKKIVTEGDDLAEENARLFYKKSEESSLEEKIDITFTIEEEYLDEMRLQVNDTWLQGDEKVDYRVEYAEDNKGKIICSIPVNQVGDHVLTVSYADKAGNMGEVLTSEIICIDGTVTNLGTVTYSTPIYTEDTNKGSTSQDSNITVYYKDTMTVTFEIIEDNFRVEDVLFSDSFYKEDENVTYNLNWSKGNSTNCWVGTYTINNSDKSNEGEHILTLKYKDRVSENYTVDYTSKKIIMDSTAPDKGEISYVEVALETDEALYFREDATISFKITEANFLEEGLVLEDKRYLNKNNGAEDTYTLSDEKEGNNRLNYTLFDDETDTWLVTYTIPKDEYGTHNVTLKYNDICQNGEIIFEPKTIIMDQAPDSALDLEYSLEVQKEINENGVKTLFFNTQSSDLVVTMVMCEDNFKKENLCFTDSYHGDTPIDLEWIQIYEDGCVKVKAEYTIERYEEGEHVLKVIYDDPLGTEDVDFTSAILNTDSEAAEITGIAYSQGVYEDDESEGGRIYYNKTTPIKITFYIEDKSYYPQNIKVVDEYSNVDMRCTCETNEEGVLEVECVIPNNGNTEYKLRLTYWSWAIGRVNKVSRGIVIDNRPAEKGSIQYSDWQNAEHYVEEGYGALVGENENIDNNENIILYYKDENPNSDEDKVDVTFNVKEKYFHPDGVKLFHNDVAVTDPASWTWTKVDENNYSVTYQISKADEGDHVIKMSYQDKCSNGEPIEFKSKIIRIDNQKAEFETSYDGWVSVRNELGGVGVAEYDAGTRSDVRLFYKEGTTLTFYITEKHFCEKDVVFSDSYDSTVNNKMLKWELVDDAVDVWRATYTIPETAEGEHIVTLSYQDRSNNGATGYVSEHIIMDKTPAKFADGSPILNGECKWDENVAESGTVRKYYKDDMSITFEIEEANFYPEDVVLRDSYDPNGTDITIPWNWDANKKVWVGTYTIPKEKSGEHMVTLKYQDRSVNEPAINYTSEYIVMDGNSSKLEQVIYNVGWDTAENIHSKNKIEGYTARADVNNVRLYYKNDMVITFVISEDNFHEDDVVFIDKYQGSDKKIVLDWQQQTDSNVWIATHTIYNTEAGEHRLSLTYNDRSGNDGVYYLSEYVMMDAVLPTLDSVEFTPYNQAVDAESLATIPGYQVRQYQEEAQEQKVNLYYNDTMTMTFTITEINFNSDDVKVCDNGKQVPKLNWQQQEGTNSWIATHTILKEEVGKHVITLEYQDRALNEKIDYTSETIIIDGAVPEISLTYKDGVPVSNVVEGIAYYGANKKAEISIEEDNFRASDVEIAVTTKDAVEAIDVDAYNTYLKNSENWKLENGVYVATVDFDTDARYDINITYKDLALQDAQKYESKIVVDNKNPEKHSLTTVEAYNTDSSAFKRMVDEADKKVLVADDKTRFIYQDAMTFKYAMKEINFDADQVQLRVYRDGKLLENGDGYSYEPKNNWKTDATSYIHTLTLELGKKNGELVDGKYKVEINYKDLAGHDMITYISNTITIDQTPPDIQFTYDNKDANNDLYYNKNRVATITVTDRNVVSEEIIVNVTATDIDGNVVPFDLATKQSAWTFDKETNTWTSKVTYDVNAKYDFTIFCNDMATNEYSDDDSFTVDKLAPSKDSFRFEYSTALPDKGDSNNAFYKDKVTVKIIAEDVTSPIDYFEWTYIKQPGASSINQDAETHIIRNTDSTFEYDETKRTATAEFTLTADQARQYRGNLRFKATDMAGNTSEELTDAEKIVVVDTISPTRMVEYSPASQIVNKDTLHTVTGFDYATENVGAVLLYNAPMTVTFKVNEANFYADDIVVKVNDVEKSVTNWTKAGDVWTGSLPISENGEYIVTLQYTDRSTNEMVDYVSHEIVIDTIKPQIHITYGPNDIKQQVDGIKYYDKQQTATITITEHNFRADDIEVLVKATDVNGNNINVTDYDSYLRSRSSWTRQGDTYTAQITYATDANYEFDIMYKDLALIPADDYPNDVFTVDQTAPINVSVSYSSPIYEKTIQGTAYEYYNEPIVVTITAEDDVSGIYSFDYRYFRADGASSVNAENVANKIEAQKITYSNGKKTATATFVIPASELRNGTQINGSMEYVAYNRALTTTEYKDPRCYVVDNIVPNVTVEYNDYVDYENNISYYADDIDVTITVDEANFFADDVKVSVSKDGGEQTTANVSWRNVSVDKHIGSFTLEEEGNYKVYVSYQDPATNKMGEYQSNQLTIDKTKPVVSVSGIRYNSANKKDKIGFVVTAEDINLNTKSFRPKLMAEIRDESGKLNQVDCTELGTIETVVNGKSCTYTIENIDQDGIYRFSCEVSDMSGNITADMMVTDSGNKEVSKLDYSVNRNGSTYGLDESTKKLNNSFIRDARDVIVYETNPDEISNIKITLFKNDKAIVLVEGKDYVVNKISEDGEWYKYEYVIYAANFIEDGTYRISIYSEDKAGNVAENNLDVKGVEINFGVDKTVPNLIVTNLEKNRTYPLDKLSVLMQATDNMKLVNITVELDGKVVATWDEDQIQQMSTNLQDFVFDILGDTTQAHTVTITLTDIAGNECVETISDFYVTRNMWIRFTNNKVLFYGSIMACLAVGFSFIPLWKRRKKRKEARG